MTGDSSKPHTFDWGLTPRTPDESASEASDAVVPPPAGAEPDSVADSEDDFPPTQAYTPPPPTPRPFTPAPAPAPASESTPEPDAVTGPDSAPTAAYSPPFTPKPFAAQPVVPVPSVVPAPSEPTAAAIPAQPESPAGPAEQSAPGIDALFGEDRFQHYDDAPLLPRTPRSTPPRAAAAPQPAPAPAAAAAAPSAPRSPARAAAAPASDPTSDDGMSGVQKVLLAVAIGLAAVLVLVVAFLLGSRVGASASSPADFQPGASGAPTPDAAATESDELAQAGMHPWSELAGGECIDPFTSAWDEQYAVVDCATPHAAQLVLRAELDESAYPGEKELASTTASKCTSAKVLDYTEASAYTDLQLTASYAADEADWAAGNREFLCFVSRASGAVLEQSLAK